MCVERDIERNIEREIEKVVRVERERVGGAPSGVEREKVVLHVC